MEEKLKDLILNYENGTRTTEEVLKEINKIANIEIDSYYLDNYWRSQSLEEFCRYLSTPSYEDISIIDDNLAMEMIKEIVDNVTDVQVFTRNSEALEKKYNKPSGTLSDLIFQEDLDVVEILNRLKKDTVIRL